MVFNTCMIRGTPTTGCTAASSHLFAGASQSRHMQIAVGGCLAQKTTTPCCRAPWVGVVFGTPNIGSLPTLLERARRNRSPRSNRRALQQFPSSLPSSRRSAYAAWVSISVGCNNSCTFCIGPVAAG